MKVSKVFRTEEPMEIRFHSVSYKGEITKWQMLASVSQNGTLSYTLNRVPRSDYSYALSHLVGKTELILPMKAYSGWHVDVTEWLCSKNLVLDEVL